jgi:hypothetical protein
LLRPLLRARLDYTRTAPAARNLSEPTGCSRSRVSLQPLRHSARSIRAQGRVTAAVSPVRFILRASVRMLVSEDEQAI